MTLLLDGGQLLNKAAAATALFWLLVIASAVTQKGSFSDQQVLAVKWGYMPMFLIVANAWNLFDLFAGKF